MIAEQREMGEKELFRLQTTAWKESQMWPLRVGTGSVLKGIPLKRLARSRTPQPRSLQKHCHVLRLSLGVDLSGGIAGRCCPGPTSRQWPSDVLWGTSLPQGKKSAAESHPHGRALRQGPHVAPQVTLSPLQCSTPSHPHRPWQGGKPHPVSLGYKGKEMQGRESKRCQTPLTSPQQPPQLRQGPHVGRDLMKCFIYLRI